MATWLGSSASMLRAHPKASLNAAELRSESHLRRLIYVLALTSGGPPRGPVPVRGCGRMATSPRPAPSAKRFRCSAPPAYVGRRRRPAFFMMRSGQLQTAAPPSRAARRRGLLQMLSEQGAVVGEFLGRMSNGLFHHCSRAGRQSRARSGATKAARAGSGRTGWRHPRRRPDRLYAADRPALVYRQSVLRRAEPESGGL